jgi:protein-S-isoprenylcysteine O-methyltransferase Ste14
MGVQETPGSAVSTAYPAPKWASWWRGVTDYITTDFGGGPRPWRFAWVINFQKTGTFAFLGLLMWFYHSKGVEAATSTAAWVYLALHGTYGLIWYLKDIAFPDPSWQRRITILGGVNAFVLVLGLYWAFGWLLISGRTSHVVDGRVVFDYPLPDNAWFTLCITLTMLGSAIMIAADAQKFFTLRVQRGLITDGMHKVIRHPNYTGEMMIYGGLALLVWHWFPVVVLAWVWIGLFTVNMHMKEASMSRYPEWAAYKKRTKWVIPYLL